MVAGGDEDEELGQNGVGIKKTIGKIVPGVQQRECR